MTGRILVAGIGNVFLSDDAFGVEVAHRARPPGTPGRGAGQGLWDQGHPSRLRPSRRLPALVLVDAVPMGEPPGTLAVIEPEPACGRATLSSSIPTRVPSQLSTRTP